ncbi:SapB/AmfS family lantipeptide [Streptomyces piniterrae]|uniref:SapB/AmfS family lantipeptide n=1 Tax=Streptomyces piniterrae TaxID=2571125 RepID=A0A4U0NJ27_9ACTN|nr:SapB/AmfS family lanthipeptide [Streptomyces piniterrae]TJZ54276.1 SapB/AmfS family lantipeptide [Streptomyces piniterrae]
MTILDLQGMELGYSNKPKRSGASKQCGGGGFSGLSLLLC